MEKILLAFLLGAVLISNIVCWNWNEDSLEKSHSARLIETELEKAYLVQQLRGVLINQREDIWQSYVREKLINKGLKGGAILSSSGYIEAMSGITISMTEGTAIATGFANPASLQNGVYVGGKKYYTLRADNDFIYGKLGTGGMIAARTYQSIIVGVYDSSMTPTAASGVVEKFYQDLKDQGY